MTPVFANHDKDRVIVSVFSTSKIQDAYTVHLKALVPDWHDVSGLDDDVLFKRIRQQKIDVLIDLSGHTEGQRLLVFARRAAPIQVTWLGFMGTLGMQAIDYRLTDYGTDPAGNDQWYMEKLFRLTCMASYSPPADSPISPEPPMLENGAPTLISLNNSKKITDEMLLLWGKILAERPDATLIIHVQELRTEDAVASMQPRLERLGLPLDQIIISRSVSLAEFMQRGFVADIALDTSPISGGTTTLHALWMGLPVIALDAKDATSSSSARILQGFGLGEWVADDEDAYIAKVLALMNNPDQLRAHRATTRANMLSNPLMDYRGRCAELERAYRLMWFNHLVSEKNKTAEPRYLDVNVDIAHETIVVESLLTA
jgi:predicted O-linked N-acetylglucosamine transferase (SPINDLY family)